MKKILSFCLALIMCVGLVGCGDSSDSDKEAKKEFVSEKDIRKIYSNPEDYVGKYVKLSGKVFTNPEKDADGIYFQMWADPKNSDLNTVVAYGNSDFELNSDDYVTVEGKIVEKFEGENSFGGSISAVQIIATKVKISSYIEVVSPTLKEINTDGLLNSQNGVDISVNKIEFANNETRVYYTVTNNSGSNYSFYYFNMKLIQNGKQYEPESNWDADYPEVSGDVLNGVTADGIASFPKIDQSNFDIHFDSGYSSNYDLDFTEFSFPVAVE